MPNHDSPIHLVTGASMGIGRAVARELAGRGCQVLASARSEAELSMLQTECSGNLRFIAADLSTPEGRGALLDALPSTSTVASMTHAAGSLVALQDYKSLDSGELEEHFRIHVAAPIALTVALSARQVVRRVVFIDSYSASEPREGWSAYSIIKAAAQMNARCASQELPGSQVIRVFPGAVKTRVVDAVLESQTPTAAAFESMVREGKCVQPEATGGFIADVLLNVDDETLSQNVAWDFNNPDQRHVVASFGND